MKNFKARSESALLAIFGTRPEAIKMCPLILKFKELGIPVKILLSGQHPHLAGEVLELFGLSADIVLNLKREDSGLKSLTSALLDALSPVIESENPRAIIVHGDTCTAFCASLLGFYSGRDVIHIEAGLRSGDMNNPYPEEFFRVCISKMAALHLAPTESAAENLKSEGVCEGDIFVTGNTVIDALLYTDGNSFPLPFALPDSKTRVILLTAHRRESLDGAIFDTLTGVRDALRKFEDCILIFPYHKNPKASAAAFEIFSDEGRAILCPPLSLFAFHRILRRADLVLTDSGGIQEEAAFLGKPTLVIRDNTERRQCGTPSLRVIGRGRGDVYSEICALLSNPEKLKEMSVPSSAFGVGDASQKIAEIIRKRYEFS